jgi:predicted phage terminase large subunit-like protein
VSLIEIPPLIDFIPRLCPEFAPPYHLAKWIDMLERAGRGEGVRALCAVPIRHYKTETTNIGIVSIIARDPTTRIIHLTHSHARAETLGKRIRQLAEAAGVGPARGFNTISQWRNDEGGGVTVMSADQSKLGEDCHCLVFDDPLDENGARDVKVRDEVDATITHYTARCMRRGKPGPVLGVMSRWDLDDPIGRRLARKAAQWESVHEAAIREDGSAFAPEVWPIEELRKVRAELAESDPSERLWFAQFMNDPRSAVDARFKQPLRYTAVPEWPGFRWGMGVDLAYTPGEGDWFACVVVKMYGSVAYVVDVVRERADFNMLENLIRNRWNTHGRCPIFSYISGPEKGAIRYFTDRGIPIQGIPARYNKATRAQKTIDRWNAGKVQVPLHGAWVNGFLQRAIQFTGSEKSRDDDEADALVSVLDGMGGTDASSMPRVFGSRRL